MLLAGFKRAIPASKQPQTYETLHYRIPIRQKKFKKTAG
jgi:hypothetical protein